jgi:hypothetical protein
MIQLVIKIDNRKLIYKKQKKNINMKNLRKYQDFLLENNINESNFNEFEMFLNQVMSLKTNEIMELRDDIETMIQTEDLNESISSFLTGLKTKFNSWFDDKLFKFLINRKKTFYTELVDKLNLFDLTNLDDVADVFPGFKINSMYLAGGMDEAEDTGKGWREILEYEFEVNNPGKVNDEVTEIEIKNKNVKPAYTVDGVFLDMILADEKKLNLYDKPALFNPVRKEVDRNKDDQFDNAISGMKTTGFDPRKNVKPYQFFQKTFSETIEPDDEHLLRISDVVFLGYDKSAGAGTFGELELASLIRKPVFAWLVNGYEGNYSSFKLWNIPHLSKIARDTKEMEILVKTIKKYTK